MLLAHAGHAAVGARLGEAILATIAAGRTTRDLGGTLSTDDFTAEVAGRLAA